MTHDSSEGAEARSDAAPRGAILPCVLAWLVPGAGHYFLGRRARGLAFLGIVTATFAFGLMLDGRAYLADPEHPLTYLATFANLGVGPLDLVQRHQTYDRFVWWLPRGAEREPLLASMRRKVRSERNEYGTAFLLTAGLMNLLLILDAYDLVAGRKGLPEGSSS